MCFFIVTQSKTSADGNALADQKNQYRITISDEGDFLKVSVDKSLLVKNEKTSQPEHWDDNFSIEKPAPSAEDSTASKH
jgi:hypothetical protein